MYVRGMARSIHLPYCQYNWSKNLAHIFQCQTLLGRQHSPEQDVFIKTSLSGGVGERATLRRVRPVMHKSHTK